MVAVVTGVGVHDAIISELPLCKGTLREAGRADRNRNLSVKADYAVFARDRSRVFLVELKTHDGSRNSRQDESLQLAAQLGFRKIVEGICRIAQATDAHGKYHHLLAALAALGVVDLGPELAGHTFPRPNARLIRTR